MINTNVEAIKDTNGRRIIIMPISNSRQGDYAYFDYIKEQCYNLQVGEVFYSYLMSIDTSKFYGKRDFPMTENKQLAVANLIHPVFKFIKEQFVLRKKGIDKVKPRDLYEMYVSQRNDGKKPIGKNDFAKKLEDIGIKYKVSMGINYYRETAEDLRNIAEKRKWLCKYDKVDEDSDSESDLEL